MNKINKIMIILVFLLCVVWSGAQVGLAQTIESPSTGSIRFKVKKETTEPSSNNEQPSTNNTGSSSTSTGNSFTEDSSKDLSKNSVNPISGNSGKLPSMGEFFLLSLPIVGVLILALSVFLFMKKKQHNK